MNVILTCQVEVTLLVQQVMSMSVISECHKETLIEVCS